MFFKVFLYKFLLYLCNSFVKKEISISKIVFEILNIEFVKKKRVKLLEVEER